MSLNLSETPTLQAVASSDHQTLLEDLSQRVEAAIEAARKLPAVLAAVEVQEGAQTRLARLKKAERNLHKNAKDLAEKTAAAKQSALEALIESAVEADKIEYKNLVEVGQLENRARHTSRAIEQLAEQMIPLAQITALREESHAALTFSRALEQMAEERTERLLQQMREAVTEEVVLPIDISKGVSGALLAQAAEYKTRAIQLSENADQLERAFTARG